MAGEAGALHGEGWMVGQKAAVTSIDARGELATSRRLQIYPRSVL